MGTIRLIIFSLVVFSISASAYAEEDFKEQFSCDFRKGKDMDDLMAYRDFYVKQAEKAGLVTPWSFVWTPLKGGFEHDFTWYNYHADLQAFAMFADAFEATPALKAVRARFNSIADCSSNIVRRNKIYDGGEAPVSTPPALVASRACSLKAGIRLEDLDDLWEHYTRVLEALGGHRGYHLYVVTPYTSVPGNPEVFIYGVNNNVSAWAAREELVQNSKIGQALERELQNKLRCRTGLWDAHWVMHSPFEDR